MNKAELAHVVVHEGWEGLTKIPLEDIEDAWLRDAVRVFKMVFDQLEMQLRPQVEALEKEIESQIERLKEEQRGQDEGS